MYLTSGGGMLGLEDAKWSSRWPLLSSGTLSMGELQQAGHRLTEDVNGYRQEGFGAFDRTIRRGRRLSAAGAYLHPVESRPNLEVRCRAFVWNEASSCVRSANCTPGM